MIKNRKEFGEYILRSLGAPVIQVNVTREQLEDRIDEAIDFWNQYYIDASVRMYLKQQITATILYCQETDTTIFDVGEIVVGKTSGARARVCKYPDGTSSKDGKLMVYELKGMFEAGETVASESNEEKPSLTLVENGKHIEVGIYDRHWFDVPDYILSVIRLIPIVDGSSSQNIFDYQYQLRTQQLYDLINTQVYHYDMVMKHLALINFELNPLPEFEFTRLEGKVYPNLRWGYDACIGDYLVLECYRLLDPNNAKNFWNDWWLKRYAEILVKRQWAINLKKYSGIQLAGGITLDGNSMYQEAIQEQKDMEEKLYNMVPSQAMFIG